MSAPAPAAPPTAEPIVTAGWIGSAVAALIAVAVAFGLPLTEQQTTALLTLTAVVAPLAVAIVGRRSVVEYADHEGHVRSGARSELTTGRYVREVGDLGPAG